MIREKTFKKILRKARIKVDKEMKKENPDYKTSSEKLRELRLMKKRNDIINFAFLIRNLHSSGRLNQEINKFQLEQPSELNMLLK